MGIALKIKFKKMKKTFIAIILCLGFIERTNSQTVNDIPLKDVEVEYVEIVGTSKLLSTKLTIDIDFGQRNKVWSGKDTQIKDVGGKKMEFNSMIDALNFMTTNNYEFVQAYTVTVSNQNVYHYLLKRKKGE